MLKTKLENEKNKAVKPEPNPDTGEVPLTIGLAHKLLRDKEKKEVKEMAKDDAYAIGMAQAKKSMNDEPPLEKKTIKKGHEIAKKIMKKEVKEEIRLRVESMAALKKKADKSGMPYSILKKVFDRGMAAWKGGHRPGASQHQWAYARVNSFVTKSSGTWGGADKDLAAKVRGSK
jgi:predicted DNA binding CopG/RHH family protein